MGLGASFGQGGLGQTSQRGGEAGGSLWGIRSGCSLSGAEETLVFVLISGVLPCLLISLSSVFLFTVILFLLA